MIDYGYNSTQFLNEIREILLLNEIDISGIDSSANAVEILSELNAIFSEITESRTLTDDMNAYEFIDNINYNLGLLNGSDKTIKFLHISDVHNCADSINECKAIMDNDENVLFTILTGDYCAGNGSYSSITTALSSVGSKLLALNGNHDVYDGFGNNQGNATNFLKNYVNNMNVVWGDNDNIASYWYRDIIIDENSKLRIISLDSYDYVAGIGSRYDTVYSQKQIDWFINRINELSSSDFLIVSMHEPPVNATISDYAYNVTGKMDDNIVTLRRANDFCSSRLWAWDTSLTNGSLIPQIIDKYTKKQNAYFTVNNSNTNTGSVISSVNINADFTNAEPATFLFYLCGHLHGDLCTYHPIYGEQLMLLVDNGNPSTLGNSSDIGIRSSDTSSGYRSDGKIINKITLNFTKQIIKIKRIGQNMTESYNGFGSLVRDTITFPFTP